MKKRLIALVVASALVAPLAAQADATVYGKIHLNAGNYDDGTDSSFQFNSFDSRLGVKGEHDLGNGLKATYKLEFGVNPDSNGSSTSYTLNENTAGVDLNGDGDATDILTFKDNDTTSGFSRRNMYIGLKGDFGEVRFGRHDTPLKMAQGKFDQFGDTAADLKHAGSHDGEHRLDNVIAYLGGSGNLKFAIAAIPGEGDGVSAGDGITDTISASIAYKEGPLYLALATDSYDDTGAAAGTSNSLTRLVGTYKFADSQVGVLWQSGVEKVSASTSEEDWIGLSFNTKMGGSNKFKAQYIKSEDNAAAKTESTLTGVGIDHKLGKNTTAYVMYQALEQDKSGAKITDESSFSVGYIVKF